MEVETAQLAQPKPKPWKKAIIIFLMIILSLSLIGWGGLYLYTKDNGLIPDGVKIGDINVSNLTPAEAKQKLESTIIPILDQPLEFMIKSTATETVKVPLRDLGLTYNLEEGVDQAYQLGRDGNILQKALSKYHAQRGTTILLPLDFTWDKEKLQKTLHAKFSSYNKPLTDATFKITPDNQMVITKETLGQEVNLDALTSSIENLDPLHPTSLEVPIRVLDQPQMTAAQLEAMKITGLKAKYSTWFDASNTERTENVRLSAKALDGVVLTPGEEFSFNKTVGERTSSAGYKEAFIIVNDEFVPGLGGGVCQVSSTLYNATINANLEITERHPHSLEITYVPPGQDATVAYPYLDFKFKNNTSGLLLIRSAVQGNTLTFQLYGHV
ncbi:VanW family protein [Desulfitobacterium metallireducens]|uniref:Vancomycin resistance protein n=1 Tax=Desulfitobacterium metallireducens DSM 15288 TaxID=871968 RepID=W0E8N2_9FIRM|nr:VanW family protein [Desulfitobacterium metallireducens]AHF07195.1 vancomycin resistance protein [Desulfitobacterium metallireducens DSM 15288]